MAGGPSAGFIYAVVEGVLISTASLFLASRLGTGELLAGLGARVGTVAGLLLAVRWTSDIVFGPSIGALANRLGHPPAAALLAATLLAGVIGVTQLSGVGLVLCLMVAFVGSAGLTVTLAAIANGLALAAEHPPRSSAHTPRPTMRVRRSARRWPIRPAC